jgi:leader peptidase (prepilin peptidase)/N-methyltransferase
VIAAPPNPLDHNSTWAIAWNLLRWQNPMGFIFAAVIGSALGSFANVVIHRLPRGMSLVNPGSRCPHCGQPIPFRYNVPILGYLFLRGRTKCCRKPISARYFIVELLGALILASLYLLEGFTPSFVFHSGWMILLLILAAIDWEHYRLPNILIGTGFFISVIWMLVQPDRSWVDAAWGLLIALGSALLMVLISRLWKGQWGGMGDVKLMLVLGFTFGPERFFFLFLTALLSAILGFLFLRNHLRDQRLPMGPFFAFGFWITIWMGDEIVRWYAALLTG